jgi:hypothetical protein
LEAAVEMSAITFHTALLELAASHIPRACAIEQCFVPCLKGTLMLTVPFLTLHRFFKTSALYIVV